MTSWIAERARLLADVPSAHAPNAGPDPLGEPIGPDDEDVEEQACACTNGHPCDDCLDEALDDWLDRRGGAA